MKFGATRSRTTAAVAVAIVLAIAAQPSFADKDGPANTRGVDGSGNQAQSIADVTTTATVPGDKGSMLRPAWADFLCSWGIGSFCSTGN